MKMHFARELRQYYEVSGKGKSRRYRFCNDMNLHQLADAMDDPRRDKHDSAIEASSLSKIIQGKRLPTWTQFEALCEVLKITGERRWRLEHALHLDYLERIGWESPFLMPPHDRDLAEACLEQIRKLRLRGQIALSIETADKLREWLRAKAWHADAWRHLCRLLAQVLFEHSRGLRETALPGQIMDQMRTIVAALSAIARRCRDKGILGLVQLVQGDACYIAGEHARSASLLQRAMEMLDDPGLRLAAVNIQLQNWAILQDPAEFRKTEKMARWLLNGGGANQPEQACAGWSYLSRGLSLMHREREALDALRRAEKTYVGLVAEHGKAPLLAIRLSRAKLDYLLRSRNPDPSVIAAVAAEGYRLARENGLHRHEEVFQAFMKPPAQQ